MFFQCNDIKTKMNEAGKSNTPFLFGINFEMDEGFFVLNPLQQQDILFDFNGVSNIENDENTIPPFSFSATPEELKTYQKRFEKVIHGLQRDNSQLVNLTIKTPVESSLSLRDIFTHSRTMYRLFLPERFVCFSPETFVKIKSRKIYTYPMKGTIDAGIENAVDIILNDHKEIAEHRASVDLLCNDLSKIATDVKVNRVRYIDTLKTNKGEILQVSSEIEGTLPKNYLSTLGSLIFKLLPAGSIAGAPKNASLKIIREAEQEPRGFYTGIAGYFDGKTLDTCVLIRFIEQQNNKLFFRSGGGITVNSICEKEYREAIRKIYLPFHFVNAKTRSRKESV
jgi:para-aminobenzoate synthetase component 1